MVLLVPRCPLDVPLCSSARNSFTLLWGDDYLGRLLLPVGQLPVTLEQAVSQCERFPLGPITLTDWAPVTDIPLLEAFSSLHLS